MTSISYSGIGAKISYWRRQCMVKNKLLTGKNEPYRAVDIATQLDKPKAWLIQTERGYIKKIDHEILLRLIDLLKKIEPNLTLNSFLK